MTMNTRYKKLPKFPKHVVEAVEKTYNEKIGDDRISDFTNQYGNIQPHLKIGIFDCNIALDEFKNHITFLMSKPNSGIAIPHTDKSRDFGINIPIRVNLDKGDFISGRFESLSDYPVGKHQYPANPDNLEYYKKKYPHYYDPEHHHYIGSPESGSVTSPGLRWDYDERYFENVKMDHPLFINTTMPHSYVNDDDEWRVIGSLELKERDLKKVLHLVDKWV